jgi:gliding motility-associated-like protein
VNAPAATILSEKICTGDCFPVGDTMFCDPGDYEVLLQTWKGCDSLVSLTLQVFPTKTTSYEASICEDDSIEVAGVIFYPPGFYQAVATTWQGCDSSINLTLNAIICEMKGAIGASSVFCHGDATGSIVFSVTDGTPPFTYVWQKLGGTPSGSGSLANVNSNETIPNLPPGTYLITINDNFGNDVVLNINVYEPPSLAIDWIASQFNGTNISCPGESDGWLQAIPSGGTPGYTFQWSTGGQGATIQNIPAGPYGVTVTDAAGCTLTAQTSLDEPIPIVFDAHFEDPNCDGFNTGSAWVDNVTGGSGPYLFKISGGSFDTVSTFTGLAGGTYTLTVQDVNSCTGSQIVTLKIPGIPTVDAGEDVTIKLGESTSFNAVSSVFPEIVSWSQQAGLSCYDCLQPFANPVNTTTYTVSVMSADSCTASDSVTVFVLKVRDLFVPNAFSPNGDGINDSFTLFGGAAASRILQLKVFSRWGELVFEGENLPLNDTAAGWDGFFKGKDMQPGVFTWFAEVEFLDGAVELVEGDVALVR